jgi:hypothetical protein
MGFGAKTINSVLSWFNFNIFVHIQDLISNKQASRRSEMSSQLSNGLMTCCLGFARTWRIGHSVFPLDLFTRTIWFWNMAFHSDSCLVRDFIPCFPNLLVTSVRNMVWHTTARYTKRILKTIEKNVVIDDVKRCWEIQHQQDYTSIIV